MFEDSHMLVGGEDEGPLAGVPPPIGGEPCFYESPCRHGAAAPLVTVLITV